MTTSPTTSQISAIMEALDMAELPEAQQEELLLDLNSLIFKGSIIRLMESMDGPTRDSFNALIETDPEPAEVERFLDKKVPGAEAVVQDTIADITSDILAVSGMIAAA